MMMQQRLHLLLASLSIHFVSSNNVDEALRYSKLPPTVFAPDGRLFGVERVAREAMTMSPTTSSAEEDSTMNSCTVLAIRCGENDDNNRGELTIMVGIGPISPSLYRDSVELYHRNEIIEPSLVEEKEEETLFYKSLLVEEQQSSSSSGMPISILSPTLVTATGGTSIDSSLLLRRSIEVALSIYQTDNGGIDFFTSHSLEGMTSPLKGRGGGASGVTIEGLVRRIADMAQSSTQTLGGKYGRMLCSSLLAMGVQQQQQSLDVQSSLLEERDNNDEEEKEACHDDDDKLCIWRVDPTGQFWKCDASAVGRGTSEVEAELLSHVRKWKIQKRLVAVPTEKRGDTSSVKVESLAKNIEDEDEMEEVRIANEDVRSYLRSLTEEEAIKVASDCLVNGLMNCKGVIPSYNQSERRSGEASSSVRDWMEYDLRRRMHCVILRSSEVGKQSLSSESYEIVRHF